MKLMPIIPKEYLGDYKKNGGYTKTTPRVWTNEETKWVKDLMQKGYTVKEIATSIHRSPTAVSIKIKRMRKNENTYNKKHINEKYKANKRFLEYIRPKTILDLYCGEKSYYKELNAVTNDINKNIEADYHEDAFKLICKLYYENKKYDLIDLDPYGSAYDCYDLAIKMAKKGLIITLGELGHQRWKRLDYVSTHYDINNMEEFNEHNIIEYIKKIGLRNHKELIIYDYKKWQNIGRVYFEIRNIKITSQWKNKKNLNEKEIIKKNIPCGQTNIFDFI